MAIAENIPWLIQIKTGSYVTPDSLDVETVDLMEAGKNILHYCRQKWIKTVVILDKSWRFLSQYLRAVSWFSEVVKDVFFVDHDRLLDTELRVKYKKRPKEIHQLLSKNALREVFSEESPHLFAKKSDPVLLLDEFWKSGKTIKSTQDAFEKAWFRWIHTGVFFCHSWVEHQYDTVWMVKNTAPFFYNSDLNLIEHQSSHPSLISVPWKHHSQAASLRKDIQKSIERCLKNTI